MATSLKKVTENYHYARANHIGARGMTRPPVGAQNKYKSRSSFSPLPWEDIYPSGLYTAIVHNGPLRTRIQDHLDEFEEFKAHLQRAQELFLGWIVTLYSLILVVAWNALESTANRLIDPCMRHVHARISWMPCPAWTKQAIHSAVVLLLAIWKSILDSNPWFRNYVQVNGRPRSLSAAKRMSPGTEPGTPVNAKLFNGPQPLGSPLFFAFDLLAGHTPPEGDYVPFLTEMSSQGANLDRRRNH